VTNKGNLYTFGFAEQYRLGNCTEPGDEEYDEILPYLVGGEQFKTRAVLEVDCASDHTVVIAQKKQQSS